MVLMPHRNQAAASHAAEKLRLAIEHTRFDKVGALTVSFGVT